MHCLSMQSAAVARLCKNSFESTCEYTVPTDPPMRKLDRCLMTMSEALSTLFARPAAKRDYPASSRDGADFSERQKRASGRYMRVNHVGEICAQALYQSQALTAAKDDLQTQMRAAADEEVDHLAWCERRLQELGGRTSLLNPVWYGSAFVLGSVAGLLGDRWNLGLVAETERQVVEHLQGHLGRLPESDLRSREIVEHMRRDEQRHADQAIQAGAAELPGPVKGLMRIGAKIMLSTAYRL